MSSLPATIKRIGSKQPRKGGDIVFRIVSQWGLSVAMEIRVLIQSAPKPYAAFPLPQWYYINFDQDWPTGSRDIQVWKCGQRTDGGRTTDHWYTTSSPCEPSDQMSLNAMQNGRYFGKNIFVHAHAPVAYAKYQITSVKDMLRLYFPLNALS